VSRQEVDHQSLMNLEKSLKYKLHPVQPRRDFVGTLRDRLENSSIYDDKRKMAVTMLLIAIGLVTGLAIFLIGRQFMNEES
jgi:hypothetical protein